VLAGDGAPQVSGRCAVKALGTADREHEVGTSPDNGPVGAGIATFRTGLHTDATMTATLRTATTADADQIAGIYAPSVVSAATSFEREPPSAAEMARRVGETLVTHPWLVVERSGEILGFARAGRFKDRAAYDWSVETSVYIRADVHRAGVGRALYTAMLGILVLQGYYAAYAGATLPNAASAGLHESMGFTPVGVYRAAGYKFGAWHDVGWWQRLLQPLAVDPHPPHPLAAVIGTAAYARALVHGARELRI